MTQELFDAAAAGGAGARSVRERQEDVAEEMMGPAVKIAYKDGVPTPAAVAFAKKAGVEVEALEDGDDAEGRVPCGDVGEGGASGGGGDCGGVAEGDCGDLLGEEYVLARGQAGAVCAAGAVDGGAAGRRGGAGEFGGKTAGDVTYGHRVLSGDASRLRLRAPGSMRRRLQEAYVMADVEARRQRIRKALDQCAGRCRGRAGGRIMRWSIS